MTAPGQVWVYRAHTQSTIAYIQQGGLADRIWREWHKKAPEYSTLQISRKTQSWPCGTSFKDILPATCLGLWGMEKAAQGLGYSRSEVGPHKMLSFQGSFLLHRYDSFQVILAYTAFHKSTHNQQTPWEHTTFGWQMQKHSTLQCHRDLPEGTQLSVFKQTLRTPCLDFTLPGSTCELAFPFSVHANLYDSFHFLARFWSAFYGQSSIRSNQITSPPDNLGVLRHATH